MTENNDILATAILDKPYVTSRTASQALGVPREVIEQDIEAGCQGAIASLIGGKLAFGYVLASWQLTQPYFDMHRKRLTDMSGVAT